MFNHVFLAAIGGFFGTALRVIIGQTINTEIKTGFPWATLIINLSGSFIIGLLMALALKSDWWSGNGKYLLAIGFCGGFTTFSSLSLELFNLIQKGQYGLALTYALLSLLLGVSFCVLGFFLAGGKSFIV